MRGEGAGRSRHKQDPCIIGVDIGTTGCRSIVFDSEGNILASQGAEYPIIYLPGGGAEQDPEVILSQMLTVIKASVEEAKISPSSVAALSLSSVFHSLIALDAKGNPLTGAIIWVDTRSTQYAEKIRREVISRRLYENTGCPITPAYPFSKILWMKNKLPEVYKKTDKFVSIKAYLIFKLTGQLLVDQSVASGSGLLNIHRLNWDEDTLAFLELRRGRLSQPVDPTTKLGPIAPQYARQMGISSSTSLIVGCGDGVLANLGSGAIEKNSMAVMIGASGATRVVLEEPKLDKDEKARTWCYYLADQHWVCGAAVNSGGNVYRWFRDRFCRNEDEVGHLLGRESYEILDEYAAQIGVGSEGLIFLPYLSEERSPYWNAQARGVFFGLSLHHTKKHLARAVLEGISFCIYTLTQLVEEVAGKTDELRATGGFTHSPLWIKILADICGREILIPHISEATAFGAFILAERALGQLENIKEGKKLVKIRELYKPNLAHQKKYSQLFGIYKRIYEDLEAGFAEMAKLRSSSSIE